MEYHQEVLDRGTGHLTTQSPGDWITVTELGQRYGMGPRKVRAILHHMGVLGREGRSYRLSRQLVDQGIGLRHDFTRSGHAFDVISPKGQGIISSVWSETVTDYEAEAASSDLVATVREALSAFEAGRREPLGTSGEVRWVLDHFPDIKLNVVAKALEVSPALVTRYANQRASETAYRKRKMQEPLEELSVTEKLSRMVVLTHDAD
ncbi:hypothetical protein FG93_03507 [Bosea sp. LC85]|uniref:hypothetical protein n=1 Tax=Bosea sp. LC85 TaxID=1502851 RepID=UPI0004E36790|nr:hypothetical protein [Bosea sp. LC85]KFC68885.1 hypothetical protein FG93_03507 [Bosea sp. LC85]